ncbi:hypothetical protein VPH35_073015 [Triticum aestivum]
MPKHNSWRWIPVGNCHQRTYRRRIWAGNRPQRPKKSIPDPYPTHLPDEHPPIPALACTPPPTSGSPAPDAPCPRPSLPPLESPTLHPSSYNADAQISCAPNTRAPPAFPAAILFLSGSPPLDLGHGEVLH